MNINFELYRIFCTVASKGSVTAAAQELNISQPAVSKSIKNLEDQLGGTLFVRTRKGVHLTNEGEEFYSYIKSGIEYFTNAENKFTDLINLETGNIRIGVSTTLTKMFLIKYIEEFHLSYPKVNIEIITDMSSVLLNKLRNGLVDLVVFNINSKDYENDLEIYKCKELHDCFVVGREYKYLKDKTFCLKDLNNYPLILQSKDSNTRKFLDEFAKNNDVILNPNVELASYTLVGLFTKIGFGIGYVTKEYHQDEFDNGDLFQIHLKESIPSRFIGVAVSKKYSPSFSTKKLIEFIKK